MGLQQVYPSSPITRTQLHERLRAWLAQPGEDEDRIDGGSAGDGRKRWIYIEDKGTTYWIHADALRKGADVYLRLVQQFGEDIPWSIDPRWKKKPDVKTSFPRIVYGPAHLPATSFFMYTSPPED